MGILDGTAPDATDDEASMGATPAAPAPAKKPTSEKDGKADDPGEEELVKEWLERIKKSKAASKTAFKQMAENEYLATHGASKEWRAGKNYTVAIVNRHINQAVAALYARDPVATAKPRDKMRFTVWDGRQDTIGAALQLAAGGDPTAMSILKDIMDARQQEQMVAKAGRTLEILWKYFTSQQANGFRKQMKALVRRTKVDGVSFVKLTFQRALEPRPEIAARIEDATSQLAATERLLKEGAEGEVEEGSARQAELKSLLDQLQDQLYLVVREGPVFDFPKSRKIHIDPACTHLKTLTGARWVAAEFDLDDDEIKEIYGGYDDDLGGEQVERGDDLPEDSVSAYDKVDKPKKSAKPTRRVYEIQDKRNSQFLTVCEGYPKFLKKPAEPEVAIDRFFTIFPLVFNEIESDEELYPPSDVELLIDTAAEYNRSRQGLREHRQANRPKYVTSQGMLAEEDMAKLANHPAHAVLELRALKPGEDVGKLVQRMEMIGIDPNQYGTQDFFSDIERIVGTQQANLGTGSNTTATETSIVEQGRQAGLSDSLDDLDELLSDLALAAGQLMLLEMSAEMVKQIVGQGAVWPDAPPSRQEISENLYLDIKAGSTGRPNRAVELANIERAAPLLLQIPGFNPTPLLSKVALLLDLDLEEMTADNAPSITAMNAMLVKMQQQPAPAQPGQHPAGPGLPSNGAGAGGPNNPAMQGAHGAANAPAGPGSQPGPQPGMTAQQLPA